MPWVFLIVFFDFLAEGSLSETFPTHLSTAPRLEVMLLAYWAQLQPLPSCVMALLTQRDASLQTDIVSFRNGSVFLWMMRNGGLNRWAVPSTELALQEGVPISLPLQSSPRPHHKNPHSPFCTHRIVGVSMLHRSFFTSFQVHGAIPILHSAHFLHLHHGPQDHPG